MEGTPSIECRDPRPDEWFRVRLGVERGASTLALRDAGTGDLYLVTRDLWHELRPSLMPVCLRACINLDGGLFLWVIPLPAAEGGPELHTTLACVVADLAEKTWCRVVFDADLRQYVTSTKGRCVPDPLWPDVSFLDLVQAAFGGRVITSLDHPIITTGGES